MRAHAETRVAPTQSGRERRNNLDILRLAAAITVLLSHSFPIAGVREPRSMLNPTHSSWGQLGVLVFFSISGYLIAGSWIREPRIGAYWRKRASRLLPALIATTVASAWVLGPLVTTETPAAYFRSPGTWLYPPQEILLLVPPIFRPAGVFSGNPLDDVNASLWTLPIEVSCYLALMVLFLVRAARPTLVVTAIVGFALLGSSDRLGLLDLHITSNAQVLQAGTFTASFFTGTALFLWRDRVPLRLTWAAGALVVVVAAGFTPAGTFLAPFLLPYVVLTVGLAAPPVPLGPLRGWDLSYGIYVYAFPVQQAIVQALGRPAPWIVSVLALAIVLPLAALSWRYLERPALAFARPRARSIAATPLPSA